MAGVARVGEKGVMPSLPGILSPTGWQAPEAMSFEEWQQVGAAFKLMESSVLWWTGDWLAFGEKQYGETYAQALDSTDYSYQALRDAKWVSERIDLSRRRDNLSHSHHREVAALSPDEQNEWLGTAENHGWSQKELRRALKDEKRGIERKQLALDAAALGKFPVIYADPPWSYSNSGFEGSAEDHYPTMNTDAICAMPVKDAATDNAVLFMWATNPLLEDAIRVIEAWGFEYKTNFVWTKEGRGMYGALGFYNYGRHELLMLATCGSFLPEGDLFESVIDAAKAEHSRKPGSVYDMIKSMYRYGPYLELFARQERDGWKAFGNEVSA
tara:strand:- start:3068 stop:4048 length:981 start_codon:yes stop_codon:yes gene_type:complete